jgi:hypothetical protein
VKHCSNELLQRRCPKNHELRIWRTAFGTALRLRVCCSRSYIALKVTENGSVIFLADSSAEFDAGSKECDSDARRSKCSVGPIMPALGEKT